MRPTDSFEAFLRTKRFCFLRWHSARGQRAMVGDTLAVGACRTNRCTRPIHLPQSCRASMANLASGRNICLGLPNGLDALRLPVSADLAHVDIVDLPSLLRRSVDLLSSMKTAFRKVD